MRYLSLVLIAVSLFLAACNKNEETSTVVDLPIREQFVPGNIVFDMSDTEFKDKVRPWVNRELIVNSEDEIPDDPFGFPESYYKINFTENTLLLCYDIHDYNVVSVTNWYYRYTIDNTYSWCINLGVSGKINEGEEREKAIISRYAILVRKLPADAKVKIYYGLLDHNWDWGLE